jgi:hypothetical protein
MSCSCLMSPSDWKAFRWYRVRSAHARPAGRLQRLTAWFTGGSLKGGDKLGQVVRNGGTLPAMPARRPKTAGILNRLEHPKQWLPCR